jgi:hypothetical protein
MPSTNYTYSVVNDFPNSIVNTDRLVREIRDSSITISLDGVGVTGDDCIVTFRDSLNQDNETILDNIIANHSGTPDEDSIIVRGGYVRQGFYPDSTGFANYNIAKGIQLDPLYNVAIRGAITTDEGSFRDDFDTPLVHDLTGSVSFVNGSSKITGTGTVLLSELSYYKQIKLKTDSAEYFIQINDVFSDTEAELVSPYLGSTGTGTASAADWGSIILGTATITQTNSEVILTSGTASGNKAMIFRIGDYLPTSYGFHAQVINRYDNQIIEFGATNEDGTSFAIFEFSGTDETEVTVKTTNNGIDIESKTIKLPGGRVTSDNGYWQVDVTLTKVSFYYEEIPLHAFNVHIPQPYQNLNCFCSIENTGTSTSNELHIDVALLSNYNKLEIKNSTRSEPIPIMVREETHTIYGKLTTTATTADQPIIQFEIPERKTCYIIGFHIENCSSSIGLFKLGRNDVSSEPVAPGELDSNINSVFYINENEFRDREWGAIPRFIGMGGDILKLTVTPNTSSEAIWRASVDLILR